MMKKSLIAILLGMTMIFTGAGAVMAEQPEEVQETSGNADENEKTDFGDRENGGSGNEGMDKSGFGGPGGDIGENGEGGFGGPRGDMGENGEGGFGGPNGEFGGNGKGGFGGPGGGFGENAEGGFGGMNGGPGGFGGMSDKSDDTELQEMISEVKDQFTTGEYTDEETGLTVPYNIYLPKDYDESKSYPMVVFIGDATTVGTDMEYSLTQGWGGIVWATAEEQEKQEAIVLVPVFPETVINDNNGAEKSDYLLLIPRLIEAAAQEYAVDSDRIYGTGQSMGAMATLYTAAHNPDLYAAVLIVDGQWDTSELSGLETQHMVYITAGGDEKATQGQTEVKAMLDDLGVTYAEAEGWDAQADAEELAQLCETLFAEGKDINFITWEAGTVLNGSGGSEHMASFDYAYKLSAVRDWLFAQSK